MNGLLYQLFSVPSIERVYHWMALVPLLTTKINFRLMLCLKMIQFASWLWLFFGANIETCDEGRNKLLYLEAFVIYMIIISDLKFRRRFLFSCIFLMCATIDQNTRDSRTPTMRAQSLRIVFSSHEGFQNGEQQTLPSYTFLLNCLWSFTNCTLKIKQHLKSVISVFKSCGWEERRDDTFWEIRSKWLSWRRTIGSSDKIAHELQVSVSIQSTKKSSYCSTF